MARASPEKSRVSREGGAVQDNSRAAFTYRRDKGAMLR
jgi:hypothetical protein